MCHLKASDFGTLHSPQYCELPFYLQNSATLQAPPADFAELLVKLGRRHEARTLELLQQENAVFDLSALPPPQAFSATQQAVAQQQACIYQPALLFELELDGHPVTVTGRPDFILFADGGYTLLDAKLPQSLRADRHPHIIAQLHLYAWLFEQCCGFTPRRLQVRLGNQQLAELPVPAAADVLASLRELLNILTLPDPPFSPVGWSKCSHCGFRAECWQPAVDRRDVAVVSGVDKGLARYFYAEDLTSWDQVTQRYTADSLAGVARPWGQRTQKVGKAAPKVLRNAHAMTTGDHSVFGAISLPPGPNWVMFDLEGIPPLLEDTGKIYLWGLQVYGTQPGPFQAIVAERAPDGDRLAWTKFLATAAAILQAHPGIPFVHWHRYERWQIEGYIARYGDPDGTAQAVLASLFDLLPAVRDSIALPLPSLSLKEVEKYPPIGFTRQLDMKGDVSIARYIEAVELDGPEYEELMAQILAYNEEDLAGMWKVFEWVRGLTC